MTIIPNIVELKSYLTRSPRDGEIEGKPNYFIDLATFHHLDTVGSFIETSNHYGTHYGTSYTEFMKYVENTDLVGVKAIDVATAIDLKAKFGDSVVTIFLSNSYGTELIKANVRDNSEYRIDAFEEEQSLRNSCDVVINSDDAKEVRSIVLDLLVTNSVINKNYVVRSE